MNKEEYENVQAWIADRDDLAARLAEAERNLAVTREALAATQDALDAKNQVDRTDADRATDSASAVQPEGCCLDYPRCDCNSPPEPDDDWLCFRSPSQPKVTP
jgi:hypothetical protein